MTMMDIALVVKTINTAYDDSPLIESDEDNTNNEASPPK